jgi:putative ATPase
VERGTIRLIGATTENPSFEIISALLSRCRVYVLQPLTDKQVAGLLRRALEDKERGLGALGITADDDALELMAGYSSGDCRNAYNTLEVAAQLAQENPAKHIDRAVAGEAVQQRVLQYDKNGEEHYNLISALHKSVRNSDPDAALYWLARMFAAGEDPLYLARRVVRMAVEDLGLAAPEAMNLCLSAKQTMEFLGSPEGDLALAEAVVYLCLAPKSNSVYKAWGVLKQEVEQSRQEPVPLHLRNAPTKLMKALDYGKGYQYAHDEEGKVADMDCLPDSLKGRSYYQPTQEGREKLLGQRMEQIRRIKEAKHLKG